MTKPRPRDSMEEAVMTVIRIMGVDQASAVANVTTKTFRDYSDPDRPGVITFQQAIALDSACRLLPGNRMPFLELYLKKLSADK